MFCPLHMLLNTLILQFEFQCVFWILREQMKCSLTCAFNTYCDLISPDFTKCVRVWSEKQKPVLFQIKVSKRGDLKQTLVFWAFEGMEES